MNLLEQQQQDMVDDFVMETDNRLTKIEKELTEPRDRELESKLPEEPFYEAARKQYAGLVQSAKQFKSDIVVVVTMGILKAGKSTLTNLLARCECASPTGFGIDTTLRPAMIRSVNKEDMEDRALCNGRIVIYYHGDYNFEEGIGAVMNELRRMEIKGSRLIKKTYPLTNTYLRKALCEEPGEPEGILNQEPLLVVVETPYNADACMLQDGRMLLDMPGLDSARADVSLNDEYKHIIDECDMVLFLQSSVAPLNEKAGKYLQEIFAIRPTATAWLIQNRMLTKPWTKHDYTQKEVKEQERKACALLIKKISPTKGNDIHISAANLGMAYDYAFLADENFEPSDAYPTKESLRDRSGYWSLESDLYKELKVKGRKHRFDHCKARFAEEIRKMEKVVEHYIESLTSVQEEARMANRRWVNFRGEVEKIITATPQVSSSLQIECKSPINYGQIFIESWNNSDIKADLCRENISGSVLDRYIAECHNNVQNAIDAKLKSGLNAHDIEITGHGDMMNYCNDIIRKTLNSAKLDDRKDLLPDSLHQNLRGCNMEYQLSTQDGALNIDVQSKVDKNYQDLVKYSFKCMCIKFERKYKRDTKPWKISQESIEKAAQKTIAEILTKCIPHECIRLIKKGIQIGSKDYLDQIENQIKKWDNIMTQCQASIECLRGLKEFFSNKREKDIKNLKFS